MFYPHPVGTEKLPVAVVMPGWRGSKEKTQWIGRETAKLGFAVLVVTAKNHQDLFGKPQDWVENYRASLASLDGENARVDSPLKGSLDLQKVSLIGYSMGGGGAFYFADSEKVSLASIIALAPFSNDSEKPGATVKAPTLVLTGTKDSVAPTRMGKAFYDALPEDLDKDYVELTDVNHNDFERGGNHHSEIFSEVSKWLKLHGR